MRTYIEIYGEEMLWKIFKGFSEDKISIPNDFWRRVESTSAIIAIL